MDDSAFSPGMVGDAVNVIDFLLKAGYSYEEIKEESKTLGKRYRKRKQLQAEKVLKAVSKSCPACDSPMYYSEVNISPQTKTGDNSKSTWLCRKCLHQIYTEQSLDDLLKGA